MKWAMVLVLVGCASRDEDSSKTRETQCTRLRDHVIDLRLASAPKVDVAAHRKAMQQALGDDFISSCVAKMTDEQVDCSLHAADANAVASCNQLTTSN